MASTVVSLSSIVLLCTITAVQGRKTLHHLNNEWLTSYSVINDIDGICKTMVETQGYTCEEHQVTTEDGYILSLQRIPVGRSSNNTDKPPVLLQHGIFCAYWDWSWDELASYDLPAFVQYVYNHTGQRIHYAGHSLGTLMALASFCQGQVVNMLRSAALLSPIAHMNQITSLLTKIAADAFLANDIYWLGLREFVPNGDVAAKFAKDLCHILNFDCSNLMSLFAGPNCCINSSTIDVFLDHEPPPTATKNLVHLSQTMEGKILYLM
ncbi:hypothetical protein GLYMA_08G167700v4 [Glycine max]|nr:hypothetical protein GLYMA_08G167700v4 [Glycine max]KAH1051608.1 hypothetical protein GYH30_021483 [Glycine max]